MSITTKIRGKCRSLIPFVLRRSIKWAMNSFLTPDKLGACGKNTILETPVFIENPKGVFMEDYSRLRKYCTIMNAPNERVFIKKFTAIATGVVIITGNHRSTVGIPHFWGGNHT